MKIKAKETLLKIGPQAGEYRYVMTPERYHRVSEDKLIAQAARESGLPEGAIRNAYDSIARVINIWATEGLLTPVPGLGSLRFGLRTKACETVEQVSTELIKSRRLIFYPCGKVKKLLAEVPISITCYDRDGNVVKRVNSADAGEVEDPEEEEQTDNTGNGGSNVGGGSGTGIPITPGPGGDDEDL